MKVARWSKREIGAMTAALLLTACHFGPAPEPPPAPSATCATACEHLAALGCPSGSPTPGGASCEQVCLDATLSGLVRLDLGCLATISSCSLEPSCSR